MLFVPSRVTSSPGERNSGLEVQSLPRRKKSLEFCWESGSQQREQKRGPCFWSLFIRLVQVLVASWLPALFQQDMGKQLGCPGCPASPLVVYMSWQPFPHWNLLIKPLGLSLQGFPEVISLPRPKRWVSRVSSIRRLIGGKLGSGVRK